MKLFYDIETSPLPIDLIEKLIPEFEAAGNIKDPVKIAASVADKRADWLDKSALRAITGYIVAVTVAIDEEPPVMRDGDELSLIRGLLDDLRAAIGQNHTAYSWNGSGFDLLFLCQRAAVHDIPAFSLLTTSFRGRRYWSEHLVDAMQVWNMTNQHVSGSSLATVALALGVGEKNGSGKDFTELLKTDRDAAIAYAKNDIMLLRGICQKMGI